MPIVDPTRVISDFAALVALFFKELVANGVPIDNAATLTQQFLANDATGAAQVSGQSKAASLRELLGIDPKVTA